MPRRDIEDEGIGVECPACEGEGRVGLAPLECKWCDGTGVVSSQSADEWETDDRLTAEGERGKDGD